MKQKLKLIDWHCPIVESYNLSLSLSHKNKDGEYLF